MISDSEKRQQDNKRQNIVKVNSKGETLTGNVNQE